MAEQKLEDALSVKLALKNYFQSEHGNKLVNVELRKVWYHGGVEKDIWEAEGDVILKGFLWTKKRRSFKYQLDPKSGAIIGYQEVKA